MVTGRETCRRPWFKRNRNLIPRRCSASVTPPDCPNLRGVVPTLKGGWDHILSLLLNSLRRCGPNLGVADAVQTFFQGETYFSDPLHECSGKGWDHGLRLGTPLFLNAFSCPQPPRKVGTGLGPPARLGQSKGVRFTKRNASVDHATGDFDAEATDGASKSGPCSLSSGTVEGYRTHRNGWPVRPVEINLAGAGVCSLDQEQQPKPGKQDR